MALSTVENSETARNMEWAHIPGRMEHAMRANGIVIRLRDSESLNGQMVGDSKGVGNETNFMVEVYIHGRTDEATMVNTLKIKSMDSVSINGRMERSTKDIGKMENSTDRVNLQISRANQE